MNTQLNFNDIFNEFKCLFGEKYQQGVADQLEISPPAISDAKKKNTIPDAWYEKIEKIFGVGKTEILRAVEKQLTYTKRKNGNNTNSPLYGSASQVAKNDISTLGERLRLVMGIEKVTQQRLADAAGINRGTVVALLKDKVENPHVSTIHKLAEYLGCNPIWLETGTGEMFDIPDVETDENIPTSRRLAYLKGSMTLNAFAKKCKIDEATMAGYLQDGRIRQDEHVYQIAKACNTSIGWLTAGEAWQDASKKYTGFSLEKHQDIGEKLYCISQFLQKLTIDLQFSYPLTGNLSRPWQTSSECRENIDTLRHFLEENLYEDSPDSFDTKVYYCGSKVDEKNKHNENLKVLFDAVIQWQKEEYGEDQLNLMHFMQLFYERFPEISRWRENKTIIKNIEEHEDTEEMKK
ncbi:MAG: helix-turn-helix domain-containing protein [Desulfobulbus sp.]|jgi:transcriptional regulator with XRE-family HTH domain